MNDFVKQKIAFSVALLAVTFAVTPLLQPFGEVGFALFGVRLTLIRLYYFLSIVLLFSTYAYATQFLTERNLRYPAIVGNSLYALAIVSPAVYVVLFVIKSGADLLGPPIKSSLAQIISTVLSVIVGACGLFLAQRVQRVLGRKEKTATVAQLEREETRYLKRAEVLLKSGNYDLAVVEAWKAIEVAARRRLFKKGVPVGTRTSPALEIGRYELLPIELLEGFQTVRQARNNAAHAIEPTTKDTAESAIKLTTRILAALTSPDESENVE